MSQRPPINTLEEGIWSSDIEKYPDTDEHRKENPELYEFEHCGYKCSVRRGTFYAWNGYVTVPESHPDYGKGLYDVRIPIHCGLVYADKGTFGFDCCQCTDIVPSAKIVGVEIPPLQFTGATYKDYDFAVATTKKLAEALKERE